MGSCNKPEIQKKIIIIIIVMIKTKKFIHFVKTEQLKICSND